MANPDLMTGLGAALAIFLCSAGSVVGSIQGGLFALRTGGGWKSFIPIVQAGVLAIYGIIIAILLCGQTDIKEEGGYRNFAAGLSVGSACLASGYAMAKFLEWHMKPVAVPRPARSGSQTEPLIDDGLVSYQVPPISPSLIMVMIFLESIGLYGLIAALFLQGGH